MARPLKAPWRGREEGGRGNIFFKIFIKMNHAPSPKLYWSYDPHRLRELVSPVCGIFINLFDFLGGGGVSF